MNSEEKNLSDSAIMSQLTGYLDGELDSNENLVVEERLANDQKYRKLMQQLQQSWDLLDILPASSVNRSFTQSTMKLVVQDAQKSAEKKQASSWTWPLRILALLLVPVISSLLAFQANRYFQVSQKNHLAENLPLIKDLDVLSCDENLTIEFLEAVAAKKSLFGISPPAEDNDRKVLFQSVINDFESLALLTNTEKNFVRNNNNLFVKLSETKKSRIRKLNDEINSHPKNAKLRIALFNYFFWLQDQTENNSARVRDQKDVNKKLTVIREIVDSQFLPKFASELSDLDRERLLVGLMLLTQEQYDLIDDIFLELFGRIELLSLPAVNKENLSDMKNVKYVGFKLRRIYIENPNFIDEIADEKFIGKVKGLISMDARGLLALAREFAEGLPYDQRITEGQLLTSWILESYKNEYLNNDPSDQELEALCLKLPADEQERLENERPADRKKQLKQLWFERNGQIQ